MAFFLLALMGCQAHTPPDDVVATRLRVAVTATCAAIGLPIEERPTGRALDDQVGLLAMRLSAERVNSINSGALDRQVVLAAFQAALKRRAARQSTSEPPRLLAFLLDKVPQWTNDQTLLASALLAQFEHEAQLVPKSPGLIR
jgi:hypothetical protein